MKEGSGQDGDFGIVLGLRIDCFTGYLPRPLITQEGQVATGRMTGLSANCGKAVLVQVSRALVTACRLSTVGPVMRDMKMGTVALILIGRGVAGQDVDLANQAYIRGDYGAALHEFRALAVEGDAVAQHFVGTMHAYGQGVPRDHGEALKWFRMAAENGLAEAQTTLGLHYERGQGVPQDQAEAARWYLLAAGQGETYAQASLGFMYGRGQGVPLNPREEVRWFRKAAEQGLGTPQFMLGIAFTNYRGVPVDPVMAHAWFDIAATGGDAHAGGFRDELEAGMSPEQVAEAKRIASSWVPGSPLYDGQGVSFVKRALWRIGHDISRIDDQVDDETRAAIAAFQQERGLPTDGEFTAELEQMLRDTLAGSK